MIDPNYYYVLCSNCKGGTAHVHEWKDATCTEPKVCLNCGATEGEVLGHNYEKGTCTRCGEKDTTWISGDIDGNKNVDVDDVLALLWNVLFPDEYPIEAEADFDGNGETDVDDVLTLLWHVLFPDDYPLN